MKKNEKNEEKPKKKMKKKLKKKMKKILKKTSKIRKILKKPRNKDFLDFAFDDLLEILNFKCMVLQNKRPHIDFRAELMSFEKGLYQ